MVNFIGTGRGDLLVGTNRDDYFEPRGNFNRPVGTIETDTVAGEEGFDSMAVSAISACTFIGSAGTGDWSIGSSDGNTSVIATGIEEVYFQGSNQNDVFNTGNATGTIAGGGLGDIDLWVANFGGRSVDMQFAVNSTFGIIAVGISVQNIERINLTTGSGRDVIFGGFEGDTINSGAGDDRVDAGQRRPDGSTNTDVLDLGAGRDTLIVNARLETESVQVFGSASGYAVRSTSNRFVVDSLNTERLEFFGGSGNDFINSGAIGVTTIDARQGTDFWVADLSAATGRGIDFETSGRTFARDDLGIRSVDGIDRINLTTSRFDDTVIGGAEGDTVIGGGGDDRVDLKTRRPDGSTQTDFFDGGAGVDLLIVNAQNETGGVSVFLNASGFGVRSTSGRFSVDADNCENIRITTGSGNDVINTGDGGERINGGGGIDLWIANYSATAQDIRFDLPAPSSTGSESIPGLGLLSVVDIDRIDLTTGSGDDTVTGGRHGDTVTTGAGRDTVNMKTRDPDGSTNTDIFNAGGGLDTLVVDARQETDSVQLLSNTTGFLVRSISNRFVVDANDCERVRFVAGSGDDFIDTGAHGGAIDGSSGIDRWSANFGASAKAVIFKLGSTDELPQFALTSIKRIEAITLTTGRGDDRIVGGAFADTITSGAGDDLIDAKTRGALGTDRTDFVDGGAGDDTLLVDATNERDAVQLFAFNGDFGVRSSSNNFLVDTDNVENVRFLGGRKADAVSSGDGRDELKGQDGNDTLSGGRGQDTLFGGNGKDSFLFDDALGKKHADVVIDFFVPDDVVLLDDAIFTTLGLGRLSAGQFRIGGEARDADDRIIYQSGNGDLLYDPDGNGQQEAVLFANVAAQQPLTAKDFFVV